MNKAISVLSWERRANILTELSVKLGRVYENIEQLTASIPTVQPDRFQLLKKAIINGINICAIHIRNNILFISDETDQDTQSFLVLARNMTNAITRTYGEPMNRDAIDDDFGQLGARYTKVCNRLREAIGTQGKE